MALDNPGTDDAGTPVGDRPAAHRIADVLAGGVRDGVFPGAVWAVGSAGGTSAGGAVGVLDPGRPDGVMDTGTVFDVASLTKIVVVWALAGGLVEGGKLQLDAPLGTFWPETAGWPLEAVTARQLLTHTAGMPLRANLKRLYGTDPQDVRDGVVREALRRPPGEAVEYTDRAALILGYLVEHLSGRRLDELARDTVWAPLGMTRTRFGPLPDAVAARCAPTELDPETGAHVKGGVHDYSARLLGGVCGISGVFTVVDDLAAFLRYVLAPGSGEGRPFGADWVAESLRVRTGGLRPPRGLFWHPATGTDPADDTWAHHGFTGTAMWLSPSRDRWAVLLTNKLFHGRAKAPMAAVRDAFRRLAFGG